MIRRLFYAWLVASIALIGFSITVRAVEPLPYGPYGTVKLNGAWVPDGTPVLAFCNGVEVGSGTTQTLSGASRYSFSVAGDDPETTEIDGCLSGETVSFTVDGWVADQTGTWVEGASEQLNLTALRPEPAIAIEKATNGIDADSAPGPRIHVGEAVTWTYAVTNTGNVTLTNVTVDDDVLGSIACPQTTLAPDLGMTCEVNGAAEPGQYANVATVEGTYESSVVSAMDSSHYFGENPGVVIEKATNGTDADRAPGVYIVAGDPITWTYTVTNTGNTDLTNVAISDSDLGSIACSASTLHTDESMTCYAYGTAVAGQYENVASVSAQSPLGFDVSDSDSSYYYGAVPDFAFEKLTKGTDADLPPGPYVLVGSSITWSYVITNTGNITLTAIVVRDDQSVTVHCPDATLGLGASMTCTGSGTASKGQYANRGTVTVTPLVGGDLTATDGSHYFGIAPVLRIEKSTNGEDADQGTGPLIPFGDPVSWTYGVTNTGNITLTGVTVVDDSEGLVVCPQTVLAPDTSMICEVSGAAIAGQYINTATVTGTPPAGSDVRDSDASGYYGTVPGIKLQVLTNGVSADTEPGPFILVGDPVTWTYVITNSGNISVSILSLVDSRIGDITGHCPATDLEARAVMTCTALGTAVTGQSMNLATVEAIPPVGDNVTATNSSYYYGAVPLIEIEKATLGIDADEPSGPVLLEGETVTWTYAISNTGNVTLTAVTVTDDQLGLIECPVDVLEPGARQTCEAVGVAVPGQYRNLGIATGSPPGGLESVSARDLSHYFAYTLYPSVRLEKRINGVLALESPGLYISAGEAITWSYTVLNTGNTQLQDLSVRDDQGTPDDPSDDLEICTVDTLGVQAATVCTSTGLAVVGAYVNVALVTGTAVSDEVVSATSQSHYYGAVPSLAFNKSTNGQDADTGVGPLIAVGDTVTWTYTVTNTGNITLTEVTVTDDQNVTVVCPSNVLAALDLVHCTASGTAISGTYRNVGSVSAKPWVGEVLTAADPSHYYGSAPSIDLEKATNGVDGDVKPGIFVTVGQAITWTYRVTNTGNVDLSDVGVLDSVLGPIDCPQTMLAVGEGMTCEANSTAVSGQYVNLATVMGTSPLGTSVSASDASHYFGAAPALTIETLTIGKQADEPDGPRLWAGYPVTWTYALTNTGNVTATQITVVDDREGDVACSRDVLAPEESMTCYTYGHAVEGSYANVGMVSALAADGTVITASDQSHYLGVVLELSVHLELSLDEGETWVATDSVSAPTVLSGTDPQTRLVITNTGSITATDMGWASDTLDLSTCGFPDALVPDEVWTCTISSSWRANLRTLDLEVSASAVDDAGVRRMLTSRESSYYYGAVPRLAVKKFVSGDDGLRWHDADTPPGPSFPLDAPLRYRFVVTNTGNVVLRGLGLDDDALSLDTCTWDDPFAVDEVSTCEVSGSWTSGAHVNTVTAAGRFTDVVGSVAYPSDSDRAHYFGTILGLSLEKRVASDSWIWYDADSESDALTITVETPIFWRVIISNTGTVPLSFSILDELDGVPLALDSLCDVPLPDGLSPGAGYQCTFEDSVTSESPGLHVNRLSVEGTYNDAQVRVIDEAYVTVGHYRVYLPVLFR